MSQPQSRHRADFVPRLEALRGVAALIVAASHIGTIPVGDGYMLIAHPRPGHGAVSGFLLRTYLHLTDGLEAVMLFFVLSGFVLALSLSRSESEPGVTGSQFVIARLFRIYPAAISSVAIFVTAQMALNLAQHPIGTVIANMLLIDASINGVMWSLQLEVLAIPLILAAYFAQLRWPRAGTAIKLGGALLLVALSFAVGWNRLLEPYGPPLQMLYAFLFGMLIADFGPALAPLLTRRRALLATVAAIVLFFAARPLLGPGSNWRFIVNGYAAAALILVIAYGPAVSVLRGLDTGPLRFLGRVSYSFYLLHPVTLLVLWHMPATMAYLLDLGIPELALALGFLAVTAAFTAALAGIQYRQVERPGMAAGRAVIGRLGRFGKPRPA